MVVSEDRTNKVSSIVNVVPIVDAAKQDNLQSHVFIGEYGMCEKTLQLSNK